MTSTKDTDTVSEKNVNLEEGGLNDLASKRREGNASEAAFDSTKVSTENGHQDEEKGLEQVPKKPVLRTGAFWLMYVSVIMAVFLVAFSATMLGTATPSITSQFHTVEDVGWYAAAYLITNCAMSPFTGTLYRMFHIKTLFLLFIGIFEVGTLVAATAQSSDILIVGRSISGIGGSGIVTGAFTITAVTVPAEKRPMLTGIAMSCLAIGQAMGPLIGGSLSGYASWRWCFYINLPLGGMVIMLLGIFVKIPVKRLTESNDTFVQKILKIDLVGFFAFAAACVMLLLGIEWGGTSYAWNSPTVIGLVCGGIAAFICLAGWFVYKGDSALIPPRLSKDRINVAIALTTFVQSGGLISAQYWLPIWFQGVKGASPFASGVMILPTIISQIIAAVICGALVQRTGYYLPEVLAGNAMVAVGAGLMIRMSPDTTEAYWIGYQILIGAGRGFVMQLLVTAIQTNLPAEDASIGASYVMFSQYLGGAVLASASKSVFTSSIGPALREFAPNIDPRLLINSGVRDLRTLVPESALPGTILAYNDSIRHVFFIQLSAAIVAFFVSCFTGWRKVTKKTTAKTAQPAVAESKDRQSTPDGGH